MADALDSLGSLSWATIWAVIGGRVDVPPDWMIGRRRPREQDGWRRLAAAVLATAIEDLEQPPTRRRAIAWLRSRPRPGAMSLDLCCQWLGLDASAVRTALLGQPRCRTRREYLRHRTVGETAAASPGRRTRAKRDAYPRG